jgi:hypothetical protein
LDNRSESLPIKRLFHWWAEIFSERTVLSGYLIKKGPKTPGKLLAVIIQPRGIRIPRRGSVVRGENGGQENAGEDH